MGISRFKVFRILAFNSQKRILSIVFSGLSSESSKILSSGFRYAS
jgi:hypothetical protein